MILILEIAIVAVAQSAGREMQPKRGISKFGRV
jgi:hypothetical protein